MNFNNIEKPNMENKNDDVEVVKHENPTGEVAEPVTDMESFKLKASYIELRDKARKIIKEDVAEIKSIKPEIAEKMAAGPLKEIKDPEKRIELLTVLSQGEEIFDKMVEAAKEGKPQDQKESIREVVEKLKGLVGYFESTASVPDSKKEAQG